MAVRKIEKIIGPGNPHFVGDGFRVHNLIPGDQGLSMQRMNPFIMLDYNAPYYFPPSEQPRGVDVHPHRGFETVTIAYKGSVEHHDSSGGGGIIGEGDVQWMTAASGVLHKEFHEQQWSRKGGHFQMVQLWVNLPAKDKMSTPKYQALTSRDIPRVSLPDQAGEVEVIAGNYRGTKGAATTFTPMHVLNAKLKKGSKVNFSFPSFYNTAMLVIEGTVAIDGEHISADHFMVFENIGEDILVEAADDAILLVLSGEPIDEPIVAHGPFVMNTREEIANAFEDYRNGKFGLL